MMTVIVNLFSHLSVARTHARTHTHTHTHTHIHTQEEEESLETIMNVNLCKLLSFTHPH